MFLPFTKFIAPLLYAVLFINVIFFIIIFLMSEPSIPPILKRTININFKCLVIQN